MKIGPWSPKISVAKALGARTYFTGKPCVNGHLTYRFTSSGHCSDCDKMWDEARIKNPARREAVREATRRCQQRRRATMPELLEKERAYDRARRLDPEQKERARRATAERRKDPAYVAREREYKRSHPEQVAASNHRRRARLNAAEGSHEPADILRILMLQGRKCAECKKRLGKKYHVDHIMPLSKGGSNWPSNLQVLCQTCNQQKHAQHPIEFAQRKGRLL